VELRLRAPRIAVGRERVVERAGDGGARVGEDTVEVEEDDVAFGRAQAAQGSGRPPDPIGAC